MPVDRHDPGQAAVVSEGSANIQIIGDGNTVVLGGERLRYSWPEAWDFDAYMQEKRESFIGRHWLFDEIEQWLSSDLGRALLIRADFGVGKSALIAEYVHRSPKDRVVGWHFCRHDIEDTLRPGTFVRSMAAQLGDHVSGYRKMVESREDLQKRLDGADADPSGALDAAVLTPLAKVPRPDGVRLLVLDALDEALELDADEVAKRGTLVDLLARSAQLFRDWLRVLVTSRSVPQVLTPLKAAFIAHEINAENPGNLEDLRAYVLGQAARAAIRDRLEKASLTPQRLADRLVGNSGGKFLFVVHSLRELASGERLLEELDSLPPGMEAFYLDSFERRFGTDPVSYSGTRELLSVMCAAREPLSRAELAEILGTGDDPVRAIQRRLPDFLSLRGKRLSFDHASLREWLTQEDDQGFPRAGRFVVSVQDGEFRIRSWARSRLKAGEAHTSPYLLRHLAAHLTDGAERQDAYAELLLERFEWSQARLERSGVAGLLEDTELLAGHPEQPLFQTLLKSSELTLRRSVAQWPAQVLGRLGADEEARVGLDRLVSSAVYWLSEHKGGRDLLVPATRSLRWVTGQDQVFEGHTGGVTALAVLPDGRIASGGWDHSVRLWDPSARIKPQVFEGHTDDVTALAVLPDGRIASGSKDHSVRLWDPSARIKPQVFEGHTGDVRALAVLPDGRIASGAQDNSVRVWDPSARVQPQVFEGHTDWVTELALLPDGRIVSGSTDRSVRVWDPSGRFQPRVFEGHIRGVTALAVLPDGRIASGSDDCSVRLWDPSAHTKPQVFKGHRNTVNALAVLPDGRIASGGDSSVRLWDPSARSRTQDLESEQN
jgi:hypothetical protein